jgi:hypothetical protein
MADEAQSQASDVALHRGRLQAQGGGTEKSVSWLEKVPPTESDMLRMCDQLEAQLTPSELKERQEPLQKLRRHIRQAAKSGGICADPKPYQKSFSKRGSQGMRVDLEVHKGKACVPDNPHTSGA